MIALALSSQQRTFFLPQISTDVGVSVAMSVSELAFPLA